MEQSKEPHQPVNDQLTNKHNSQPEHPKLTHRQQQKQDALDLAELIYDMFQDSLSSATIGDGVRKDNQNA